MQAYPQPLSSHPAFNGPVKFTALARPQPENDETSTGQTAALMARFIRQDAQHPIVRRATYAATAAAAGDQHREALAIHAWIRAHVRFVEDSALAAFRPVPEDSEVLVRPVDLLTMPAPMGDCDDSTMLCAAMLRAVGIPAALKTVAANPDEPETYTHIYTVALLQDGPFPLDCSTQAGVDPRPGWEVPAAGKSRLWPIDKEEEPHMLLGDASDSTVTLNFPGFSTPAAAAPAASPWLSVLNTGLNDAAKILTPRYAVPQLNAGQYIQTAQGTYYQQPAGSSALSLPGLASASSSALWIGGLLIVALVIMMGGRK